MRDSYLIFDKVVHCIVFHVLLKALAKFATPDIFSPNLFAFHLHKGRGHNKKRLKHFHLSQKDSEVLCLLEVRSSLSRH